MPTIGVLISLRAVQGLGAALLLPGTPAVITHALPERGEQARAVGIWDGVSALALPAGLLIGGAWYPGWAGVQCSSATSAEQEGACRLATSGGAAPHARHVPAGLAAVNRRLGTPRSV